MSIGYLKALDIVDVALPGTPLEVLGERLARAFGYDHFLYRDPAHAVSVTNGPNGWSRHYRENSFEAVDPIRITAERSSKIIGWSVADIDDESRDFRAFIRESARFGAASGLHIPLPMGFGHKAFLAFSGRQSTHLELGSQLTTIAFLVGARFGALVNASKENARHGAVNLSAQEVIVLSWSAEGKTMSEIATILGIARRTVEFHLSNAKTKLGATTVTHAVALGMRAKVIH